MSVRWLLALVLALPLSAAVDDGWSHDQRQLYFGIPVQVRFTPADETLAAEVWQVLESVDGIFNDYQDGSEIGRINKAGAGTYELSPLLAEAFAGARHLGALSGGAFDISVGSLRRLWKGAAKDGVLPTPEAISAAKATCGPGGWSLSGRTLTIRHADVRFDFGGFCKGMAVDWAIQRLKTAGRTAALVQVGGETGCFGRNPRGISHTIGIPHPDHPDDGTWIRFRDPGTGISGSTSGNYRQPILISGKPYYHIYDPVTGEPAPLAALSASIVFPGSGRNALADGLCKVGILRGPDVLIPLVESLGGQCLLLVRDAAGQVQERHSAGWAALVVPP